MLHKFGNNGVAAGPKPEPEPGPGPEPGPVPGPGPGLIFIFPVFRDTADVAADVTIPDEIFFADKKP